MKILVVNWLDRENPAAGGAEEHLHRVFGLLARWGHEVHLLASGWEGAEARAERDGIRIHRTGGRHTFSVAAPAHYRRHLRSRGFDVLVEDLNKVPLFSPWWADEPVVLLVHHLFGRTAFQEASWPVAAATWLLERPLARAFQGVPTVAVSESTARDLEDRGFSRDLVEVIPNGVDVDRLTPEPDGREFEEPSLLYLGRLKRYKRVDLVLRATARLREQGVPCRLRVGGEGDHRGTLERLARDLELEEAVDFLGFVPEDEKVRLLRRSWVHVLTSPKEGWGIVTLEAAACGTPTVASDSPGLRDSVREGVTGLLVPHGDVDALAGALARLLRDRGLRERMGRAAREFAESLRWEDSARRMEAVLGSRVAAASGLS